MGLAPRARFVVADFDEWAPPGAPAFDCVLALAVFEYSRDPESWLRRMHGLGKEVIATFPLASPWQQAAPQRERGVPGPIPASLLRARRVSETCWSGRDSSFAAPRTWGRRSGSSEASGGLMAIGLSFDIEGVEMGPGRAAIAARDASVAAVVRECELLLAMLRARRIRRHVLPPGNARPPVRRPAGALVRRGARGGDPRDRSLLHRRTLGLRFRPAVGAPGEATRGPYPRPRPGLPRARLLPVPTHPMATDVSRIPDSPTIRRHARSPGDRCSARPSHLAFRASRTDSTRFPSPSPPFPAFGSCRSAEATSVVPYGVSRKAMAAEVHWTGAAVAYFHNYEFRDARREVWASRAPGRAWSMGSAWPHAPGHAAPGCWEDRLSPLGLRVPSPVGIAATTAPAR